MQFHPILRPVGLAPLALCTDVDSTLAGATWKTSFAGHFTAGSDVRTLQLSVRTVSGPSTPVAIGIACHFPTWSTQRYVLLPGSVYAGNRFPSRPLSYAPRLPEAETSPQSVTTIADIHRLETGDGPSAISLLTGDMSVPAFGGYDPETRRGQIILARDAVTPFGPLGFDFSESLDRTSATLRILAPGMRDTRYEFNAGRITTTTPSADTGHIFHTGDEVSLVLEVHEFSCTSPQGLFDRLAALRSCFASTPPLTLPISAATNLIKDHFNSAMWWPEAGLYRVWPLEGNNPYQTGWCGGIIAEYALLSLDADSLTHERCHTHLDHALTAGISASGLPYGKFTPDLRWDSDCWPDENSYPWRRWFTLTRRHGDALFYALKACAALRLRGLAVPSPWLAACRGLADALCRTWETQGQWGQFLDQRTGEVRLGGSASGALIPAALLLAHAEFGDPRHRAVALAGGEHFYSRFTVPGVTTGGPGDALQAPDSESSYALVESYWALHYATGDALWLTRACEAARQFASWVMPYDYPFPAGTEFHRLGLRTAGTVFANAQNAHSAPGICTHSGLALLHLFRATGERTFLDLLASIARALPQFVSRPDRPIHAQDGRPLPSGWINERVNTSDWDNNVGGVFYGPTWCEVSLLLTAAELPGIYARPADGLLVVLDNVRASWADSTRTALVVENPTAYPASVRIFIDRQTLPAAALPEPFPSLAIPAGQSAQWTC
jgi:hypothetical protein